MVQLERLSKELLGVNSRLEKRFSADFESTSGHETAYDPVGSKFISYAVGFDFDPDKHKLSKVLKNLETYAYNAISGLFAAKQIEEPEGKEMRKRRPVVHWRMCPTMAIEGCTILIRFRCTVQQNSEELN